MKKNFLLFLITLLALSIKTNAQLNYLFTSASKPYVPVTGGIAPHLTSNNAQWEVEDEGSAKIPIGFTFKYDGGSYTKANVHVNGFISFKDFFPVHGYPYFENSLKDAVLYNERPVIAAFWDDLLLTDTLNLVYKTTGFAPFRVCTIEWKKVKWVYESLAPVLSIEMKLYETTNIIEFHYKDEGSLPDPRYAFASIGITSAETNRDFISLQSSSANPAISLLRSNDSLSIKPANNQLYRFTPSFVNAPANLRSSLTYTNNKISFKLTSGGPAYYEYALTHSPIPPASGTGTFASNITIPALSAATTWYVYARTNFLGLFKSQWVCDSLTTAVDPVTVPWHLSGNVTGPSYLPADMRVQNFMDTFYHFHPYSDADWQVVTDLPNFGDTSVWALNTLLGFNGNSWLFTPGIHLAAGKTYQLKFGYLSYSTQTLGEISSLEVKYGKATGEAAMTSGLLFKRTDIVTDFDEFGGIAFSDTTIEISPVNSGIFYFGFHNLTMLNNGQPGPVPIIGNISVSEKVIAAPRPFALTGKTINSENVLNWTIADNKTNAVFEVQGSADGIHFQKIAGMPSTIIDKSISMKNQTDLKVNRRTGKIINIKEDRKSKFITGPGETASVIELKRSGKGNDGKDIKMAYTDHSTKAINYYRLQRTGKDGKTTYSNIVRLKNDQSLQGIKVYPNPAKDILNINIPFAENKDVTMLVTDVLGNIILNKMTRQINKEGLDISQLPPGAYFLKIICENGCGNFVTKFIKQ